MPVGAVAAPAWPEPPCQSRAAPRVPSTRLPALLSLCRLLPPSPSGGACPRRQRVRPARPPPARATP
eukprot:6122959-Pleurochrysis_carterae.AAC.1